MVTGDPRGSSYTNELPLNKLKDVISTLRYMQSKLIGFPASLVRKYTIASVSVKDRAGISIFLCYNKVLLVYFKLVILFLKEKFIMSMC